MVLKGRVPIDMLVDRGKGVTSLDKIVTVCAALTNFCESVVPFDYSNKGMVLYC